MVQGVELQRLTSPTCVVAFRLRNGGRTWVDTAQDKATRAKLLSYDVVSEQGTPVAGLARISWRITMADGSPYVAIDDNDPAPQAYAAEWQAWRALRVLVHGR